MYGCKKILNVHALWQPLPYYIMKLQLGPLPHAAKQDKMAGHYCQALAYLIVTLLFDLLPINLLCAVKHSAR